MTTQKQGGGTGATVTVAGNGPVRLVGDCDVHEVLLGLFLLGSAEKYCASECVASHHPASSFLLGEYDGVDSRRGRAGIAALFVQKIKSPELQ
jgi:hypothetical protein